MALEMYSYVPGRKISTHCLKIGDILIFPKLEQFKKQDKLHKKFT